jgi:hypothetical protein
MTVDRARAAIEELQTHQKNERNCWVESLREIESGVRNAVLTRQYGAQAAEDAPRTLMATRQLPLATHLRVHDTAHLHGVLVLRFRTEGVIASVQQTLQTNILEFADGFVSSIARAALMAPEALPYLEAVVAAAPGDSLELRLTFYANVSATRAGRMPAIDKFVEVCNGVDDLEFPIGRSHDAASPTVHAAVEHGLVAISDAVEFEKRMAKATERAADPPAADPPAADPSAGLLGSPNDDPMDVSQEPPANAAVEAAPPAVTLRRNQFVVLRSHWRLGTTDEQAARSPSTVHAHGEVTDAVLNLLPPLYSDSDLNATSAIKAELDAVAESVPGTEEVVERAKYLKASFQRDGQRVAAGELAARVKADEAANPNSYEIASFVERLLSDTAVSRQAVRYAKACLATGVGQLRELESCAAPLPVATQADRTLASLAAEIAVLASVVRRELSRSMQVSTAIGKRWTSKRTRTSGNLAIRRCVDAVAHTGLEFGSGVDRFLETLESLPAAVGAGVSPTKARQNTIKVLEDTRRKSLRGALGTMFAIAARLFDDKELDESTRRRSQAALELFYALHSTKLRSAIDAAKTHTHAVSGSEHAAECGGFEEMQTRARAAALAFNAASALFTSEIPHIAALRGATATNVSLRTLLEHARSVDVIDGLSLRKSAAELEDLRIDGKVPDTHLLARHRVVSAVVGYLPVFAALPPAESLDPFGV